MLNLGGKTLVEAYIVLEINENDTDEEVKKAFRKLALKPPHTHTKLPLWEKT